MSPTARPRTRRPAHWLGEAPGERFLAQIPGDRLLLLVFLLFAGTASVWIDAESEWWDSIPVIANLVTSLLLLLFTLLLVDEWLKWRAAEAWTSVAAFALEDLGRVSRAVWYRQAQLLAPAQNPMTINEYRAFLRSPGMRDEVEDGAQRALLFEEARLFDESRETARRTRDLILAWSPALIPQDHLASYLADVTTLHRTLVQVLRVMSITSKGHRSPITDEQLCKWHADVLYRAMDLDERLHAEASLIHRLDDYAFEVDELF